MADAAPGSAARVVAHRFVRRVVRAIHAILLVGLLTFDGHERGQGGSRGGTQAPPAADICGTGSTHPMTPIGPRPSGS